VLKSALGTGAAGLKIIRPNMSRLEMFHSRLNRDVDLETAAAQLDGVSPWPSLIGGRRGASRVSPEPRDRRPVAAPSAARVLRVLTVTG